jgi:Ca-activated chloride channel family protein
MKPTVKYGSTLVTKGRENEVEVLLELTAPDAPTTERQPLDVVAVIDRSGSMSGDPLQSVLRAVAQLLRLAGPNDRIGVVVFDTNVQTIVPLERHTDVETVAQRVLAVTSGGSTNLSGGWLKAMSILEESGHPEALKRIVVLTDGHANVGLRTVETFAPAVVAGRVKGITTSCIGFADGYDEEFLAAVADAGSGNDYWCAGPDQAMQVFADEFNGLAAVVAQNLEVVLTPADTVRKVRVRHDFPVQDFGDRRLQVSLGDSYGGETRKLLVTWKCHPREALGPVDLGEITVKWVSVVGEPVSHSVTIPVAVTVVDDATAVVDPDASPEVLRMADLMRAERARRRARRAADVGDFSGAQAYLVIADDVFNSLGMADEASVVREDLLSLRSNTWSAAQSKRAFSRGRSINKGRKSNYDDPGQPGSGDDTV